MAIKRKGILARPGTYNYSWGEEIKTAEELEKAAKITPTIKLTLGHPSGGRTHRSDFLGYVKPKWNDEKQLLEGDFWFYEDHLDKIPEHVRDKIISGEPWKISTAFTVEEVEDGVQKDLFFDHVAILRDEDSPVCPLGECGVNLDVRQEAESIPKLYLEQESVTGETVTSDENTTDQSTSTPPPSSDGVTEVEALKAEIAELKELIIGMRKEPSEQKPEEPEKTEGEVPERAEVEPDPSSIIQACVVPTKRWKVNDAGWIEIIPRPTKTE